MATRVRKMGAMTLRPGKKDAYFASHNEGFWPEMGAMLKEHGAHNYCIHLLSRLPTNFPTDLLAEIIVETTVVLGLNPQLRPLNMTMQDGCW